MDINDVLARLTDKDDKNAYAFSREIASVSEKSDEYYPMLSDFASLLTDEKSYIRTRGFVLCCCQARWDQEGKIASHLPAMLRLFHDPKPTVVRQCLAAVKELVAFCPQYSETLRRELLSVDLSGYKDSMVPLIRKDIDAVWRLL